VRGNSHRPILPNEKEKEGIKMEEDAWDPLEDLEPEELETKFEE